MTVEIAAHKCEICLDLNKRDKEFPIAKSRVAMNGKEFDVLHFCCEKHVVALWDKLGKP